MIQSLHIFRKDIRHLRPELALYAVLLITFALVTPQIWEGAAFFGTMLKLFQTLLQIFIQFMMLVLIARVIQDESLVGDQQFWITRPYAWTSLLGAKVLFIVVCIILPFVIMKWSLLLHAGLNPLTSIPALLSSLASFAVMVWLPLIAIAALTSTLGRTLMSLAAGWLVVFGVVATLISEAGQRMASPFVSETFPVLFAGLLIGLLLYQFATRNTPRAALALVAIAALFLVLVGGFVTQYFGGPVNALVRYHYPVSTNAAERLTFDSSPHGYQEQAVRTRANEGFFPFRLPVYLEGLDSSARLQKANASFTIDAPGYHYTSPWRPVTVADSGLSLLLPSEVFNRVHAVDVHMHLSVVAQRLLPGTPQTVTAADRFSVPGGNCILLTDRLYLTPLCRYAFRSQPPTRVNGPVTAEPCASSAPTHPAVAVIPFSEAGMNSDPVLQEPLQLGGNVCPGTQLTFLPYHPADNFRLELDIPAVTLGHYYNASPN